MATFRSNRYPELVVKFSNRDRVKFSGRTAEVSGENAKRLAEFAKRHPEYEIEQVEGDEKPQTPKQKAVAKAEALGLDTSGTQADIEARIAAHEAQGADDGDDEDSDDHEDHSDEDDAGAGDSSEDDEN